MGDGLVHHRAGELEYKYGDVVAAASRCGLGTLGVAPRVHPRGGGLDDFEALEFLADLQGAIEVAGLPWRHPEFSTGLDEGGDFIKVPLDFDPEQILTDDRTFVRLKTAHVFRDLHAVWATRLWSSSVTRRCGTWASRRPSSSNAKPDPARSACLRGGP